MKTKLEKEMLDAMRNNPDNWKGVFYYNCKDPRLLVPKYYAKLGWTLNFANPYSYTLIGAIVLLILAAQYFL
ncbi:MAG: hypothetical protein PF694_10025 [Bacteroidetes bacterium]|jgi:uncharacterized membrane protein|nr:hypothetical protein [Bacteroidota bacterium]